MSNTVIKADGSAELFKVSKLKNSLRRAGATKEEVDNIIIKIEAVLYDGIRTQEIYRQAFELLRNSESPVSARYSMRRALFGLGPTGFPFEDFLAKLYTAEGYKTKTRVILQGRCAEHELDVTGYKDDHSFVAEAKFHSRPGVKSDLQVALYSYARKLDLVDVKICNEDICGIRDLVIITNTKFTSTARNYAECVGLKILSWEYPKNDNLHDRIQRSGIYPITVLQSLSQSQKRTLIEHGIIICHDLLDKPHILRKLHLSSSRTAITLDEAKKLCVGKK